MRIIFLLLSILLLTSCPVESLPDLVDIFALEDHVIPKIQEYEILDRERIRILFSEDVAVTTAEVDGRKARVTQEGRSRYLITSPCLLSLSDESELFIIAEDESRNTSSFILPVSGLNDRIPDLLINEFSSRGSDSQPERIELLVMEDGNVEGVYAADGTVENENYGFALPDLDVRRGDIIVIFWTIKPEKEKYLNKSGTVTYNVYAASHSSLADNNGLFVIYRSRTGKADVIDALLYSDFNSVTYSGYGSARVEAAAERLKNDYDWIGEAFNCRSCTTTRTINRNISGVDTNRKDDFFICETRGQSFGEYNSAGEYQQEAAARM